MNTTEETIAELRAKIDELEESLKEDKFDYPICKISKKTGLIVLFYKITEGEALSDDRYNTIGDYSNDWIEHTDTDIWEDYPYDKEKGLYHKQMVYCWYDEDTHSVDIRFYNAINKCPFAYDGDKDGFDFDNYSATMPDFMLEAYKTLKD